MTVEEAIVSALDYEIKVRDHYTKAVESTDDPKGKEIFDALAVEEQGHIDYLESRLGLWQNEGKLNVTTLNSALPTKIWIAKGKAKMHKTSLEREYRTEIRMLKDALRLEREVSEHYRKLVETLDGEAQGMFDQFLQIEDAHTALVQAEIDTLQQDGFWFDFTEFDLEAG